MPGTVILQYSITVLSSEWHNHRHITELTETLKTL